MRKDEGKDDQTIRQGDEKNMNERPTPETDAALLNSDCTYNCGHGFYKDAKQVAWGNEGIVVLADFARKLERERDEAREDLAEERHAWEKEREDWQADYAAVSIENKAMRAAIRDAHRLVHWLYCNSVGLQHRTASSALATLAPFVAD